MKLTLIKWIPSSSHNAPFSEELGNHWPQGQQFKLLDSDSQKVHRRFHRMKKDSVCVEQIGGEEVRVHIPISLFPELFGVTING